MIGLFEGILMGVRIVPAPTDRPEKGKTGVLELSTKTRGKSEVMDVKCTIEEILLYKDEEMKRVELLVDVAPWKLDNGKAGISCTLVKDEK